MTHNVFISGKNNTPGGRAIKITAVVLSLIVLLGGVSAAVLRDRSQTEPEKITEEQRIEELPQEELAGQRTDPLTESDRELAEIYDFEWVGDGFAIGKYKGNGSDIELPAEYNGEPVVSVGNRAFESCSSLTSVTIPDSVTAIGGNAFKYCRGLEMVIIPDSVEVIGDGAFWGCIDLASIVIPDAVTAIDDRTFRSCRSLSSIILPDGVTTIGDDAFFDCSSLTSIALPDGVTEIGAKTFWGCTALASITIPGSVEKIGRYAFKNCEIEVKASKPPIGYNNAAYYETVGGFYGDGVTWVIED